MRFMVMIKADERTEAGVLPTEEELTAMGRYNEELVKAGVLLAGEGLHSSAKGARVVFSDGVPSVIDGPFAEAKELVAGFWLLDVKSKEEAIEWVKRVPCTEGVEVTIEIRQVHEVDDFGEAFTPELRAKDQELREKEEQLRLAVRDDR
ncbi:YciI family protein [Actinophytocola sp.]|uniref:YciI family protein n=1 Tax=Actinophytocola sp. TaxID=1872138 RepID=UPI002ED19B6C